MNRKIPCKLCGGGLQTVIDLGHHPLADRFLSYKELNAFEKSFPLRLGMCTNCGFVMSQYSVSPEERYCDVSYSYSSNNSKVSVEHFNSLARSVLENLKDFGVKINENDLVLEIGSNVGTLLQAFRQENGNIKILGIDPAKNICELAISNGINTLNGFFCASIAEQVLKIGKPNVIITTNTFNHIDDLDDFMQNICHLLRDDGMFVFEVPYLLKLIEKTAFDTIYLEHVNYFSITPLVDYFRKFDMYIRYIETNDYMGGTIRVYVGRGNENKILVSKYTEKERKAKISNVLTYSKFIKRVERMRLQLCNELFQVKKCGGKIIGIGAAAKGNTLLNYCKLDNFVLDAIADTSLLKIGKYTPGSHIKIIPEEAISDDVTHALILPWNIADFLKNKLQSLDLKFIVPTFDTLINN